MVELFSADFLKFFIPAGSAVVAWFINERRRQAWEEYLRKEERYTALLRNLSGFYLHASTPKVREEFLEEYKRCWLYCSDEVIEAVNEAMVVMIEGTPVSMDARLSKIGELVLAIRRDLLRRTLTRKTALSCNDYKGHISPGV